MTETPTSLPDRLAELTDLVNSVPGNDAPIPLALSLEIVSGRPRWVIYVEIHTPNRSHDPIFSHADLHTAIGIALAQLRRAL